MVSSTHPNYKLMTTHDNKQSLSVLPLSPLTDMCAILDDQIICSDNFSWSDDTHHYVYCCTFYTDTQFLKGLGMGGVIHQELKSFQLLNRQNNRNSTLTLEDQSPKEGLQIHMTCPSSPKCLIRDLLLGANTTPAAVPRLKRRSKCSLSSPWKSWKKEF